MKTKKMIMTWLAIISCSLTSYAQAPYVDTYDATRVFGNSAVLNGYVNPNGSACESYFIYWQSGSSKVDTSQRYTKSNSGTISQTITNLNEQTSYEYMVVAKNSNGVSYGSVYYLYTPPTGLPSVDLWGLWTNDTNQFQVNGYFFANGLITTTWYEYDITPDSFRSATKKIIQPETQSKNYNMSSMQEEVKNLKEYKKYYVRLAAKNDSGTVYSSVGTIITQSGKPPVVITDSATNLSNSTAMLNCRFDGLANCAYSYYEYGQSPKSLNKSTYDSYFQSWNCQYGMFNYSKEIYGLSPNTTYYYRAVSESNRGKSYGEILSFKTEGSYAPEVLTLQASNISYTSADLWGYYNSNGAESTEISFQHGTSIYLGLETSPVSYQKGTDTVKVSIKDIESGAKHYYRLKAKTKFGISYGSLVEFTTDFNFPPTTNTDSAIASSTTQINVFAKFDANRTDTKTWFEYDTLVNKYSMSTSKSSQGKSAGNISETLSGLLPNHTYFIRSGAENVFGIVYGKTIAVTTLNNQQPLVVTDSIDAISSTYAILAGFVDGKKSDTKFVFEWGTSSQTLTNQTPEIKTGKGSSYQLVPIYGLDQYTTYYYRIKATNEWGVTKGQVYKFRTLPNKEAVVKILKIDSITPNSAKITVVIDGRGTISDFALNYGNDLNLREQTDFFTAKKVLDTLTVLLSGLNPDSRYYLAPISRNSFGEIQGNVKELTTLNNKPPTIKLETVCATATTIVFDGYYNSNKTKTNVWVVCKDKNGFTIKTTILDDKIDSGPFSILANDLDANTWYYYQAYAQNSFGIVMTTTDSVLTLGNQKPIVKTLTPIVHDTYAILFAEVDGQGTNTNIEFVYGTDPSELYKITGKFNSGSYKKTVQGIMYGLKPNTTYFFYVSAENTWGIEKSEIMSFRTLDFTPQKEKVFLKILSIEVTADIHYAVLKASISSKDELASYWTTYGDGQKSSVEMFYDSGIRIVTIVLTNLWANSTQSCLFYLQNVNGKDSMLVEFKTKNNQTPNVKTLKITQVDDSTLLFEGKYNANGSAPIRYYFEYSTDLSFSKRSPIYFSKNDSDVVYSMVSCNYGETYYTRLVCENEIGITQGNILSLKTKEKDVTGINDVSINPDQVAIKAYPNPFLEQLTVESKEGDLVVFINIQGVVVHKTLIQNDVEQINLDHLPAGVYFIQIYKGSQFIGNQKIVKQ